MTSYVGYQYDGRTIRFQFISRDSNKKQDSKAAHNIVIDVCTLHFGTPIKKVQELAFYIGPHDETDGL